MKNIMFTFLIGMAFILAASSARAVSLDWIGKSCVVVDGTFEVCKPNTKWDTKKTKDSSRPVKWEYNKIGPDPVIWLRYGDAQGKTAHHYAKFVRNELESRGISVESIKNKVFNGRHVSLIKGYNSSNDLHYLVGVWRNRAKGFNLECSASSIDFNKFEWQCLQSIKSVRIVNENR